MALKMTTFFFLLLTVGAAIGAVVPRQLDGYLVARVDDINVKKIAEFAYTSLSASSLTPVKLVKISRAWKQVASGVNYKLILELVNEEDGADAEAFHCKVIVFDQPRKNIRKLVSTSCTLKRQRRQIPGGYVSRDVNDADVKQMAAFATDAISASNLGPVELIEIVQAASQVVAGVNYKMTLLVVSTRSGAYGRRRFRCEVIVFDQPWTNTRELSESKCFRI